MAKDSGLTDSGFYNCQKFLQKKHMEQSSLLERVSKIEIMKKRYDSSAKHTKKKTNLWTKIKSLFGK